MNQVRTNQNPFDLTKASDFSDEQIYRYWVDLVGDGGLEDIFKPTQQMPMLLLGGKGSGKTHLMRYYSSTVQQLRHGGLLKALAIEKSFGIYLRADAINVHRFDGKGYSDEQWSAVFNYYFELWLATHFLRNIQECQKEKDGLINESQFVLETKELFCKQQPNTVQTIQDLINHFTKLRKEIDYIVCNCDNKRTNLNEIDICASPGSLVFELPYLVNLHSKDFEGVIFVYLIDEIENFNVIQQKFINTLIRYRKGPTSIKIGARLYGIRTKETLGVGEEIRQDAEFEKVELDAFLRENIGSYKGLARDLIIKRLQNANFLPSINSENYELESFFEKLNADDHFSEVSLNLVKTSDNKKKERPYFITLVKKINEVLEDTNPSSDEVVNSIIDCLRVPKYPLLEKNNIHIFYRDWTPTNDLYDLANRIREQSKLFLSEGKDAAPNYFQTLDHFKSDFLAQLYRECGKGRGVYSGLDTIIELSQGIPRNLLSLLKSIYRRSFFAGEQPFQRNHIISIDSQVEGIRDGAAWFWEDAQPDSHGPEVRAAIESLAELFREVRYSLKPSECDLGTFTINTGVGTATAKKILQHAENWSYLIKIRDGDINKNNSSIIDEKYQLSPMLAAKWGVSEHRRGRIELSERLFNTIFDMNFKEDFNELLKERLKGMTEPHLRHNKKTIMQNNLF